MEQNSHHNKQTDITIIESQMREVFGRVVYSHKTQEKCADILSQRNKWFKNIQIILSALVTTGLLLRVFHGQEWALIVTTIISTILFGFTTYLKEADLGEIVQKHNAAALDLWDAREQYLSLLTDIKAQVLSSEQIREVRDTLHEKVSKIYSGSPRTFGKAYEEARKALQINEELTFSDDEIDKLLPGNLRKG